MYADRRLGSLPPSLYSNVGWRAVDQKRQEQLKYLSPKMQGAMDAIQGALPTGFPDVTVDSGYRSPSYNASVGGAKQSTHMRGDAVDLDTAGMTPEQRDNLMSAILGTPGVTGIGNYGGSSIHIDVGHARPTAWGRDYRSSSFGATPTWFRDPVTSWLNGVAPMASDPDENFAGNPFTSGGVSAPSSATSFVATSPVTKVADLVAPSGYGGGYDSANGLAGSQYQTRSSAPAYLNLGGSGGIGALLKLPSSVGTDDSAFTTNDAVAALGGAAWGSGGPYGMTPAKPRFTDNDVSLGSTVGAIPPNIDYGGLTLDGLPAGASTFDLPALGSTMSFDSAPTIAGPVGGAAVKSIASVRQSQPAPSAYSKAMSALQGINDASARYADYTPHSTAPSLLNQIGKAAAGGLIGGALGGPVGAIGGALAPSAYGLLSNAMGGGNSGAYDKAIAGLSGLADATGALGGGSTAGLTSPATQSQFAPSYAFSNLLGATQNPMGGMGTFGSYAAPGYTGGAGGGHSIY